MLGLWAQRHTPLALSLGQAGMSGREIADPLGFWNRHVDR